MRIPRTIPQGVKVIDGYPIPAGGAGDGQATGESQGTDGEGEGGESTSSTDGEADTETDGQTQDSSDEQDAGKPDKGRAGGEEALRADLARERQRRKAIQAELDSTRKASESETEAREREIRDQAQAPAIKALRSTAVEMAAASAGFLYPSDVYALLTTEEREGIEVDLEDDSPAADRDEAAKLVKALAKRRPGLLRPKGEGEDQGGGSGGSDHQGGTRNGSGSGSSSSDPNATLRGLFRQKIGR